MKKSLSQIFLSNFLDHSKSVVYACLTSTIGSEIQLDISNRQTDKPLYYDKLCLFLQISGVNKIMMRQFKRDCKSSVANQFAMAEQSSFDNNNSNSNNDAGRVVRKNPGFDPVFMKV